LRFQDLSSTQAIGERTIGRFRTAPADRRSISFVWSGDTAGQGWGIDTSRGAMRTYATMRRNASDFFVHCGDNIYADCTISAKQKLPNGETWRNIVTAEKSKAAETLTEYRGNYKYNLLDANLCEFNAAVPIFAQWDNHEVMEEWAPGDTINRRGYVEKNALLLAARGCRAFHEFMPLRYTPSVPGRIYRKIAYGPLLDIFLLDMRSYRGPNDGRLDDHYGPAVHLLGPAQLAWLKRKLARSTATWKVIATDTPLSVCGAGASNAHTPLGRGIEIADLLSFIQRAGIRNTLWITADLHYTAAHYFDQAVFQDFEPFWEFVSEPIHAGTWTPSTLDRAFGPRVVYQNAASPEQGENLAPCFGLQFFGHIAIDGATGVLTVTLKDVGDRELWSIDIEPKSGQSAPACLSCHRAEKNTSKQAYPHGSQLKPPVASCRSVTILRCNSVASRVHEGPRFGFWTVYESSQYRHHRPRRPRQDHAGRPAAAAIRRLSREPARGRARHGFQRPRARAGHHHPGQGRLGGLERRPHQYRRHPRPRRFRR
jgi:alkaline phosphatase D